MVNVYCSIKVYSLYLLEYLLVIDISVDFATFRHYHIDVISELKKLY